MTTKRLTALGWGMAAAAVLWLGCTNSENGEVQEAVLADSLAALSRMESYEVHASGELRQGSVTAEVELSYGFVAPDRLRFLSESTSDGRTERAGLLIIGERNWNLEDGVWVEQPPLVLDITIFSAERIWGLVPFARASLREPNETLDGVEARHYRFERSAQLSFESLAGALLAGTEPQFRGDLTHFTIDYWTSLSGGWPVRMELTAEGRDQSAELTVDLTKANDPSIVIEPPQSR